MKNPILVVSLVLLLCFVFGCQNKAEKAELEKFKAQAKVEEQNKELYRQWLEGWNTGNYEYLKEAYAPDYFLYLPSANPTPMSREETIDFIKVVRGGFPDAVVSIEDLMAVGDMVITRTIFRGTHKGLFQGIPPTGNRVEMGVLTLVRIKNGKFVEERQDVDLLGLMQQLGMELKPKEVKK